MLAKEKYTRNIKVLKIVAFAASVPAIAYLVLALVAPTILQRLGDVLTSPAGTPQRPVILAAAEKGGHYFRLGILLKEELQTHKNLRVNVGETAGTIENLELLRNRRADFAFIQGGVPESETVRFDGLAAVATLGWQYVHILVPVNSPVGKFKDLQGRTVSLGPRKSGNAALAGMVMGYFHPSAGIATINSSIQSIDRDFQAGKMAAFFAVYDMHAPLVETLLDSGKYRLVNIPEAEAIAYMIPGCFSASIPHGLYGRERNIPPENQGVFQTLKVNTLLVTRHDIDDSVVRDFLEVLYSPGFIKKSRLPDLNEENGRKAFDLALHPGAGDFYRRSDPVTADEFEIMSAFLALVLFFAAVAGYIQSWRRKRLVAKQKKNIEPYFSRLLEYSKKMGCARDIGELEGLLAEMMDMQRRAEKEWIDGKLDTEDMENLYSIYGIRCDNAFNRMSQIQFVKNRQLMEQWFETLKSTNSTGIGEKESDDTVDGQGRSS
jgi:TRAP transporter TAXI family solute receptor